MKNVDAAGIWFARVFGIDNGFSISCGIALTRPEVRVTTKKVCFCQRRSAVHVQ